MLNEKLDAYLKENYYPFHMPGAKRTDILRSDLPYKRDLTEIYGFDNLNDPKDIFLKMEEKISKIYKVKDAIISTNGSTCGILSTIRSLTYENKNVLIQRSCHKSVYNAIEIFNLQSDYVNVYVNDNGSIIDISYKDLENKLKSKKYAAFVITSPSYEGYYLDLKNFYQLTRKYQTSLILDMAHGSHSLLFGKYENNFDIAITSFHKNLSALTPSSAILINDLSLSDEIRRNMAIFQTSSPSYVVLQSIDEMLEKFDSFYKMYDLLDSYLDDIYNINLDKLKLIDKKNKDRSKIQISTINTNISGEMLANKLREEKIEIEMAYPSYALLIASIFDRKEGFERLKNVLLKIDRAIEYRNKNMDFSYEIPKKSMEISRAILARKTLIDLNLAENKISGQFVYAYPPGIPIIAPGEIISKNIIDNIKYFQKNSINLNIENEIFILNWQIIIKLIILNCIAII